MKRLFALAVVAALAGPLPAAAVGTPPNVNRLIDRQFIQELREGWLDSEIVEVSIAAQNRRYAQVSQQQIDALDQQWRAEREQDDQPLIAATLSSPLSVYLSRVQARSLGLFPEIFVMDDKGLNVGQSSVTSDFWQGDEAKYQKTFPVAADAVFIDEPEWDEDFKIWRVQINLTLTGRESGQAIGAATVEVNLTELERRRQAGS